MDIRIKAFVQQEQSYGHPEQSLRPVGTKLLRSMGSPTRISVKEIWIKVFIPQDYCYRDLDYCHRPAGI
jgi:hypothetical protein